MNVQGVLSGGDTHARTHTYTQINVRGVLSGGDTHTHTHTQINVRGVLSGGREGPVALLHRRGERDTSPLRAIRCDPTTAATIHNKLQAFLKLLEFRIVGSADEGSVIHPLYERYGATLQLRAATRSDAVHEKLARGKKRNERE
jgi:hypothetical protein